MFSLTVKEAADRLKISQARVYQLINLGQLEAERVGNMWLISRESADERAQKPQKAGRPRKHPVTDSTRSYHLMNRAHEVLTFRYDSATDMFFDCGEILDPARAPLGILSPRGKTVSSSALQYWWRHRSIPASREGIQTKLKELGYNAPFEIPFKSLGLSLSDQYWIKPIDLDVQWEDINFFENPFDVLEDTSDWLSDVGLDSPDNTSEGELPKKWVIEDGKRLLIKGGEGANQQPYNEVVATGLHKRLLNQSEYVIYTLKQRGDAAVCACEPFVSSEEEYIPAYYVSHMMKQAAHHNDYQHYLECCARLGVDDMDQFLSKMIVCDYLLANADRHWRNFGLIRNVETLEYRAAPLFDSGTSLWCRSTLADLRRNDYSITAQPFYESESRQLRLVDDTSWFDAGALDGFDKQVREILSANPELENRVEYIVKGVQSRIDHMMDIL